MSDVVIFGTGDYARVASVYLAADSPHRVVAFTVDDAYVDRDDLQGIPVLPFTRLQEMHPPGACQMLVAIGFSGVNQARTAVYQRCKSLGYEFITYVNSTVMQWGEVEVGENTFIFEGNVLQPFVRIGDNVVIWSANHIGHDVTIGDHVFIASHVVIAGSASVGDSCFIGINASLRDGVKVASQCVIGAGAVIMKDTEPGDVYATRGSDPYRLKSWELKNF